MQCHDGYFLDILWYLPGREVAVLPGDHFFVFVVYGVEFLVDILKEVLDFVGEG